MQFCVFLTFVKILSNLDCVQDAEAIKRTALGYPVGVSRIVEIGRIGVCNNIAHRPEEDVVHDIELGLAEGLEDWIDETKLGVKQDPKEGGEELGEDDGGEHGDEQGQELQELAQVETIDSVGSKGRVSIGGIVTDGGGLSISSGGGIIGRLLIGGGGV